MTKLKRSTSKYYSIDALMLVWKSSPDSSGSGKAAGVDGVWPKAFAEKLSEELLRIREDILTGNYGFRKLKVFPIEKEGGKKRIICIPTVRDRLVQRLVIGYLTKNANKNKQHLQKKLGLKNNPISYGLGLQPDTGVLDAVNHAIVLRTASPWVLKTDISAFFDKIDRKYLIETIQKRFRESSLAALVIKAIGCEADDTKPDIKQLLKENGIVKGIGIRQGMPLSPLLSNFFLREFDAAAYKKMGKNIIRYADDIIVFAASEAECKEYEVFIRTELEKIKQEIPSLGNAESSKTNIIAPDKPVDFLGIEIYPADGGYGKKIRKKALARISESFENEGTYKYAKENSLTYSELIARLNDKIRSYTSYYAGTANIGDLVINLQETKLKAQTNLLKEIFGDEVLSKLSTEQLQFLGLELSQSA